MNAGIYLLNQSLIKKLDGISRIDMTSLLESQINDGLEVNIFPLHEYWLDIGQHEQLEQAKKDLMKLKESSQEVGLYLDFIERSKRGLIRSSG